MIEEGKIYDWEFGEIPVVVNRRLRSSGMRICYSDGIRLEVRSDMTERAVMMLIETNRERIRAIVRKSKEIVERKRLTVRDVDFGYTYSAVSFDINIKRNERDCFTLKWRGSSGGERGVLDIFCPSNTDFAAKNVRKLLKSVALKYAKKEAERIFPNMLRKISEQTGLKYASYKLMSARGRWGSCSSAKSIHLSYMMMFLTAELVRNVMIHELCHTVYMNHSKEFWELFEKISGRSREMDRAAERECLSKWPMFLRMR